MLLVRSEGCMVVLAGRSGRESGRAGVSAGRRAGGCAGGLARCGRDAGEMLSN